ncbi:MAG: hypothetical protein AB7S38_31910 [Vulcanimicrobiota bacterium]
MAINRARTANRSRFRFRATVITNDYAHGDSLPDPGPGQCWSA